MNRFGLAAATAVALVLAADAHAARFVDLAASKAGDGGQIVFRWKGKVDFKVDQPSDRKVRIHFGDPVVRKVQGLVQKLPGHVADVAAGEGGRLITLYLKGPRSVEVRRDGDSVVLALAPPRPAAPPSEVERAASVAPAAGPARPAAAPASAPAHRTAAVVSVDARREKAMTSIRFNWRQDVGAAMFRRNGDLWVVFDSPGRVDVETLRQFGKGLYDTVTQLPVTEQVVLRFPLGGHVSATARRDGTVWALDLAPGPNAPPAQAVVPAIEGEDGRGARVVLPVRGAGAPISLVHPEIGDTVTVFPSRTAGVGVATPLALVETEILASVQGIAVVTRADRARAIARPNGVVIEADRGLSVSRAADRAGRTPTAASGTNAIAPIEGDDAELRQSLQDRIQAGNVQQRNEARVDLARLYLAAGQAPEALGALQAVDVAKLPARLQVPMRAVRAGAHALLGHDAEASADLDDPALMPYRDLSVWRAMIAALRGDWQEAHALTRDKALAGELPDWLRTRYLLISLEAALAVGDLPMAEERLNSLNGAKLNARQAEYRDMLRGHYHKKKGELAEAEAVWKPLLESPDRQSSARARFAYVDLQLGRGAMSSDDAVAELERLTFAWRGDVFEFDVLTRLAALHAERGEYRDALRRLRSAATHFGAVQGAQTVAQEMSALFRRLFLDGAADSLPPVAALGLYEDYRELTPSGADGDEMIRRLADRLAGVDLLPEAADLLDNQVRHRLEGVPRARVGARLALLHLFDRKPAEALEALGASSAADAPAELVRQRRLLEVQALAELKRYDEALKRLDGLDGADVLALRLDIDWRCRDWPNAARTALRLLDGADPAKLDAAQAALVLRAAVGLTLANDGDGLAALRTRFGAAMDGNPVGDLFRGMVGEVLPDPARFREFAMKAGELDTFRAFMAQYRERIRTASLSEMN
ncbi:MAG: hypothetical protein AB7K86_01960 [Rhodospirillales bacterium]